MLLASASVDSCNYCHVDTITLSSSQSKARWFRLTRTPDILKQIHKNNLDVVEYLDSKAYSASNLYEDMEFFATEKEPQKKKIVYKDILSRCTVCHFSEPKLASLWQDREWNELLVSSEKLKKVHTKNLAVLEFIDSNEYNNSLSKFVKKMKFFALNILQITLKEKNITFIYETNDANMQEAKYLFEKVKKELLSYNLDKDILLHVKAEKKSPSLFSSMTSIMTVVVPVFIKTIWSMQITYDEREFSSYIELEDTLSLKDRFDNTFTFNKMDILINSALKGHL